MRNDCIEVEAALGHICERLEPRIEIAMLGLPFLVYGLVAWRRLKVI